MSRDRTVSRALARGLPGAVGPPPLPVWTDDVLLSFTDRNGVPLSTPVNLLGPEGPAGGATNFITRTRAIASTIPVILAFITVLSFADGHPLERAIYKPGTSDGPMAFQDVASNWWQLDLSSSLHFASWYGVNGDSGDYSSQLQQAVTWANGIEVKLPLGTVGVGTSVSNLVTANYNPAIRLSAAGTGLTTIDNRCTSGAACINVGGGAAFTFSQGGFIKGITFKTTTSSGVAAINIHAAYRFLVEDVWVQGMGGNGAAISEASTDSDASNQITFRDCYFVGNAAAGLIHNFASGVTQTSFVRCENCFFSENGLCGWYFIGLSGEALYCGFTENGSGSGGQGGLWLVNNASSNAQFTAIGCSWENNYVQSIRADSLQGGQFIDCEIASNVIPATSGVVMFGSTGVSFHGTRVRISSSHNPFTAFSLNSGSNCCTFTETYWISIDDTIQQRYVQDGTCTGNRFSDSFDSIQIGLINGISSITCATGANHNLALPQDGAGFGIVGPTGAFSIGGLTCGYDGRGLELMNDSGNAMTLLHEDTSSTAANRIWCGGANLTIPNTGGVTLRYFVRQNRWVVTGHI